MPQTAELRSLKESLHISPSQVSTYIACPLKYRFSYVEQRQPERISMALPFGSSIHKSIEIFWRSVQSGEKERLSTLEQAFEEHLRLELEYICQPIIYKKGMDFESTLEMGRRLLKTFYENIQTDGFQVVDVEAPLGARLYDELGQPTDFILVGVVDLILLDDNGVLWAVDNKTASRAYSQEAVDLDGQLSAYACLLASNRYISRLDEVHCRFDVLRKLKTPALEHYVTTRSPRQRRSFSKLVCAVLDAISKNAFYPSRGWMCADCQYRTACQDW